MFGLVVVGVLLAVPFGHQVHSHNMFRVRSLTAHELAHRQRPTWLRLAANAAWLAYLAGAVAAGLALR